MASPSFIYAFDGLSPGRFVELCGLLLGARLRGFMLSGPGPDGGIDAESDISLGELRSDTSSLLVDTIITPDRFAVFQFKHKVVGRVGETNARTQLLKCFKSTPKQKSEVLKEGIALRKPDTYVLVTNVEINSEFRREFIEICKTENPKIAHYQVVGLDELESWVVADRNLRSEFFPILFGPPRFNLQLKLESGAAFESISAGQYEAGVTVRPTNKLLCLSAMNVGSATSYLSNVKFKILVDGEVRFMMKSPVHPNAIDPLANPKPGAPIEPGRSLVFRFDFVFLQKMKAESRCTEFFLAEVLLFDEIENMYSIEVSDDLRLKIFGSQ